MSFNHLPGQDTIATAVTDTVGASFPSATTRGSLLIASAWAVRSLPNVAVGIPTLSTGWQLAGSFQFGSGSTALGVFFKSATGTEISATAHATHASATALAIHEFGTGPLVSLVPVLRSHRMVDLSDYNAFNTSVQFPPLRQSKAGQLVFVALGLAAGNLFGATVTADGVTFTTTTDTAILGDAFLISSSDDSVRAEASWSTPSQMLGVAASFSLDVEAQTVTFNNEG